MGGGAAAADSIQGVWRTQTDRGEVRFEACGDKICGRLVNSDRLKAFPDQRDVHNHIEALRARPLKGTVIAQGFSGGPTQYGGGTLYDPAGGGTYKGRIVLTGRLVTSDRLKAFPEQRDAHNHDVALRSRPASELALIAQGFSGGPTRFSGGTVYDPAGGGTYSGRLALTGPLIPSS